MIRLCLTECVCGTCLFFIICNVVDHCKTLYMTSFEKGRLEELRSVARLEQRETTALDTEMPYTQQGAQQQRPESVMPLLCV